MSGQILSSANVSYRAQRLGTTEEQRGELEAAPGPVRRGGGRRRDVGVESVPVRRGDI